MARFILSSWIRTLPFICIAFCTTSIFFFLPPSTLDLFVFNADFLYLPSLYKSIFEEQNPIRDWYLTPAPYFFPDFFIYSIIQSLAQNFRISIILTNASLITLISLLLYMLVRKISNAKFLQAFVWMGIAFLFVIWINALSGHYLLVQFIFTISNHAGNIINTLLCAILAVHIFQEKKLRIGYWILFFLILILSLVSDNLFFLTFVIPFTIIGILLLIRQFSKRSFLFFLWHATAVVAGMVLSNNLRFFAYHVNKVKTKWERMPESIDFFWDVCSFFARHYTPFVVILLFIIAYSIFILISRMFQIKRQKIQPPDLLLFFSFLAAFASLSMAVLGGYHWNLDTIRYYIVPVYVFVLIGSVHFFSLYVLRKSIRIALVLIILLYGSFMFFKSEQQSFIRIDRYTPSHINRIIHIADSLQLQNGITDYWAAKPVYMFSNGQHIMAAMYDQMFYPYHHISNIRWAWGPEFTFAYITDYAPVNKEIIDSITLQTIPVTTGSMFHVTKPFRLEKETKQPILVPIKEM